MHLPALRRWPARLAAILASLAVLVAACVALASPSDASEGTVERVVDGDTVDIRIDGTVTRVRILNVDTPETVKPGEPVECLGPEATELTESLLSPGDTVSLEYDEEREDRYGRVLAHVRNAQGLSVGEELARRGLGVPVVVGKNDAGIAPIEAAFAEAEENEEGFFDPAIDCTLAAAEETLAGAADEVATIDEGSSAADALAAAVAVAALYETTDAAHDIMRGTGLAVLAFKHAGRTIEHSLRTRQDIAEQETTLRDMATERQADEDRIAAEKAAAKKAAEKVAAEKRAATAQAQADARAKAAKQAQANPAVKKRAPQTSTPRRTTKKKSNPSGYTGPRCYAPGGKTWRPC